MENIKLLFDNNADKSKNISLKGKKKKYYVFSRTRNGEFHGSDIKDILSFLNFVFSKQSTHLYQIPIILDLKTIRFSDKLTYIVLESICYHVITNHKNNLYVNMKLEKSGIHIEGIYNSPLFHLQCYKGYNKSAFIKEFEHTLNTSHYRKIFSKNLDIVTKNTLGSIQNDIKTFLSVRIDDEKMRSDIARVSSELIGNALEHSGSDCLLDIDITADTYKKTDNSDDFDYYGVNIVVLNFSDKLFFESLDFKLNSDKIKNIDRYQTIKEAKKTHALHFDDKYTDEHFISIAALQDKISGDMDKISSGGTGLTNLIKSLEERSDFDNCYLYTGKYVIYFFKEFLEYDEQNWIGFNKEHDLINCIPDENCIGYSNVHFPGTAYNLNFVYRKEE